MSNIQHSISNVQVTDTVRDRRLNSRRQPETTWKLEIECWTLDILLNGETRSPSIALTATVPLAARFLPCKLSPPGISGPDWPQRMRRRGFSSISR
jgi:hypothetical protein